MYAKGGRLPLTHAPGPFSAYLRPGTIPMRNNTSANLGFSPSAAQRLHGAASLSFDQTAHQLDPQRASQTMAVLPVVEPSADSPIMYAPHAARYQRIQAL